MHRWSQILVPTARRQPKSAVLRPTGAWLFAMKLPHSMRVLALYFEIIDSVDIEVVDVRW